MVSFVVVTSTRKGSPMPTQLSRRERVARILLWIIVPPVIAAYLIFAFVILGTEPLP